MSTEELARISSINLGAALEVVRAFLDSVARDDTGARFANSPEYVAARCVIERLCGAEEGVSA